MVCVPNEGSTLTAMPKNVPASMNSDDTHFHRLFNQRCILGSGRPRLSMDRRPHLYRCVLTWPAGESYEEFISLQSFHYDHFSSRPSSAACRSGPSG